jgi:hypothetical protein
VAEKRPGHRTRPSAHGSACACTLQCSFVLKLASRGGCEDLTGVVLLLQLSPEVRDLLDRILVPKEEERITIPEIEQHPWCTPRSHAAQTTSSATCPRQAWSQQVKAQVGDEPPPHAALTCWHAPHRYQKPLPSQYANAERALKADQSKVEQYVSGRSISTVRTWV